MQARTAAKGSLGDHIARVAAELFYREGIHPVGVDRIAAEAGVTKRTLYRYFHSKDVLIAAALRRGPRIRFAREGAPAERIIDAFASLLTFLETHDLRGCPFINAAAELNDPRHPARAVARDATARRRAWFCTLAAEAGAVEPDLLGRQCDVLFDGALAGSMTAGDPAPARAALAAARTLLAAATPHDARHPAAPRTLKTC